ncbi:apolipoprotein D-like [Pararge aegeria]|uniref:Jg924 protein n=1 Tax=Pararge aegeria aegeria TaxID=348720 RepID=A0A8S4R8K3_9NEOP|nr:apolipoprotein D-like [Pararge aegeria]CAH2233437.1 jg924 [Pararge aegeria aegeria]
MLRLSVLLLVATASAQIPSLGWCPDYQPMANFNVNRFLGTWYEAERFFTVSELGSRCVTTKYESTPEGRILVNNEITNALTGMKRVMGGSLQMIGREGEGRLIIKYATLPNSYDNEYSILDTDYENFAVMWSCSGIGPVHIQNAWILTRDRLAPPLVMQYAYSVLDRYHISRTFFVKTNQADCNVLPSPAADPLSVKTEDIIDAKSAPVASADIIAVEEKIVPVEKKEEPIAEVPQERSAIPEISDEAKPMEIPEMIPEKKDDKKKIEKPEDMKIEKPDKMEMKKEIPTQKSL